MKIKKLLIVILLIILNSLVFCETRYTYLGKLSDGVAVAKLKGENAKYGYIDITGKVVLQFKYDEATEFKDGKAVVKIKEKYYLIDKMGKNLTKEGYDGGIGESSEGLRGVYKNKKGGYINNKGEVIIPLKYDEIEDFRYGIAVVTLNNKDALIDKTGKEKMGFIYDEIVFYRENQNIKSELFLVIKNKKVGYINEKGETVIEPKYDDGSPFYKDKAIVKKGNKNILIESNGKEIGEIKSKYGYHLILNNKYILIFNLKNKLIYKHGLMDLDGNMVLPPKYYEIEEFNNDYSVVRDNYKFGVIDKTGKEKIPLKYAYLENCGEEGFIFAEKDRKTGDGKYGMFDKNLKILISAKYVYVSGFNEGYSVFVDKHNGGNVGFVDKTGKEFIVGKEYNFEASMPEVEIEE